MTTFINLLTFSRILLAAIIFLLLMSSDGYLLALILFFVATKNKIKANRYPSEDIKSKNMIAARSILEKVKRLIKVVIYLVLV